MKLYGSLTNRFEENKMYCDEIKVGTGMTEYLFSDRHAYEVVGVKDQKHVTVREYDHKHVGEAFTNNWELISNENNPTRALEKRGNVWYWATTVTAEDIQDVLDFEAIKGNDDLFFKRFRLGQAGFDFDKIIEKGKQTKRWKANVSFGVADYHYDYEF